jgi:hypothetical protein
MSRPQSKEAEAAAKDKDKKKPEKVDPLEAERQQQLQTIQRRCGALERLLAINSEQLQRSHLEKLALQRKMVEINDRFKEEEAATTAMCFEMHSQYRNMQSYFVSLWKANKENITALRRDLDSARNSLERTKAERERDYAAKEQRIAEQRHHMEELAVRFGEQLKGALEDMSRHITQGASGAALSAAARSLRQGGASQGSVL